MYCQNCGKEIPDGVRFCPGCGAQQTVAESAIGASDAPESPVFESPVQPESAVAQAAQKPLKERVFLGFLGALIAGVLSLVIVILMECTEFHAAIQGLCVGLAVFLGYKALGRRLGGAGIALSLLVLIATVIFAELLLWSYFSYRAFNGNRTWLGLASISPLIKTFWPLLIGPSSTAHVFYPHLAQMSGFAVLGGIMVTVPDRYVCSLPADKRPRNWAGFVFLALALVIACLLAHLLRVRTYYAGQILELLRNGAQV